jgi:hypothetical protein
VAKILYALLISPMCVPCPTHLILLDLMTLIFGETVCFCVVLPYVSVEALRWTDPPTKESYQMSVDREVH